MARGCRRLLPLLVFAALLVSCDIPGDSTSPTAVPAAPTAPVIKTVQLIAPGTTVTIGAGPANAYVLPFTVTAVAPTVTGSYQAVPGGGPWCGETGNLCPPAAMIVDPNNFTLFTENRSWQYACNTGY